jgi:hypothetical protein
LSCYVLFHSILASLIIQLVLKVLGTQERTSADSCTVGSMSTVSRVVCKVRSTGECSNIRRSAVESPDSEGITLRLILKLQRSSLETLVILTV